ncbi:Uncharacterized metal-binding protein YceD, DUF177 family [Arboricoccus pini]|uniref:Uncharacterized metal-binding protein YceD, DUF177 family n=1 Tax=Arboricoccus pini TaxID=1963835 RepID=A0A212PYV0_9PROT|nr:DUF177 domain-containing protein [Arboricoccus pini]SNB52291.1 Uncharacterized metal-binding protein YceD, DUF177 family [Arboricoccus pini]
MSDPSVLPVPEMSRPVSIHRLPEDGLNLEIEADKAECDALASRLDLVALRSLKATLRVARHGSAEVFAVDGELEARVIQTCVVSLEPFESVTWLPFQRLFTTGEVPDETEITIDPDLLDLEPLEGDKLDVGEIVVEELAVNLDPYPHAPGFEPGQDVVSEPPRDGPFAVLSALKGQKEDGR